MKRFILIFALLFLLAACEQNPADKITLPVDADGAYTGFADIPSDLTASDAAKQGLKVMNANTIKALNAVKIPIIKYAMSDKIDKDDLKTKVLKSLKNDVLVSLITKK